VISSQLNVELGGMSVTVGCGEREIAQREP